MTDYRSFVESKLAGIERRRATLETERNRLITALGVLDEADASAGGEVARFVETAIPVTDSPPSTPAPVTEAIVDILKSSGKMMTPNEIHDSLSEKHNVSRELMHSGFYRLKRRGVAFKNGKKWGLVGRDDKTVEEPSTGHGTSKSMLTNPTEHQLQPSLSRAGVQA